MPISTVIAKKIYTGNDVTTEFPFAYRFFATSDLVVEKYTIADGTLETLTEGEGEDYTVVGGDDGDGGTTDYTSGGTVVLASALEDEYKLIITRVLPLTQTFDFAPNSPFSEDSFEEALDRMIAIVQQQQAELDRCIKMDKSYSSVSGVFDVDDLEVSVDDFIIDELTAKTTIGSTDYVAIADGDASNVNKKILASSIININGLTEDASLHANDVFLFEDSQASYAKKKVTRNNLVNINSLTEKTTLAAADLFIIEDSAASNAKKKVQKSNIKPSDLAIASQAAGDILYFDGTNWIRLAKGTALQVLSMNSGATAPEWKNSSKEYFELDSSVIYAYNALGLKDISIYNNTVALTNAPTQVAGKVSTYCMDFNGSSNYITISDNAAFATLDYLTIELWFYADVTNGAYPFSFTTALYTYISNTNVVGILSTASGNEEWDVAHGLSSNGTGAWVYLVITWNKATSAKIYINGSSIGNGNGSGNGACNDFGDLRIGANNSPANYWNGKIDGLRILSREMSAAEVLSRYNQFV